MLAGAASGRLGRRLATNKTLTQRHQPRAEFRLGQDRFAGIGLARAMHEFSRTSRGECAPQLRRLFEQRFIGAVEQRLIFAG